MTGGKRPGAGRPTELRGARPHTFYLEKRQATFLAREARRRKIGISATLRALLDEQAAAIVSSQALRASAIVSR